MYLPYNPALALKESHAGVYKIYVLKHPQTSEIFYVGQTVQTLELRLLGHINDSGYNKDKSDIISQIIQTGNKPIIEAVETIISRCYIDRLAVNDREMFWIKHYKSLGCTLTNIADNKCHEYRTYLSSIKSGQSSYHYYYCGITYGGHKVYDAARLEADGFRFPEEPKPEYRYGSSNYSPFDNEIFIRKIGYQERDGSLSYVPCYKDTDPKYYDDDY